VWELNISGISTPWVAGDWVFVVASDARLMAIHRSTGKVRWITQLRRFENERRRTGPITWSGPVLAGNRLILASAQGALLYADPATGAVLGQTSIGTGVNLQPVVAGSTLYILDDSGQLHAFR
jgi:outer membrane protein assembly factor BamB